MSDDRIPDGGAPTVPLSAQQLAAAVAGPAVLADGTELAGRYRITAFLARGGMGAVYEAYDRELGVTVALKTVRPDVGWGAGAIDRFKREIQLAREVTHPGVCRIFDLGRHGELVFLTMELLRGATLAEHLAATGPLPPAEATAIVTEIAVALGAAHAAGVVHRDLKPANVILVERRGRTRAVITDFGLARDITRDQVVDPGGGPAREAAVTGVAGTPDYMAPEQHTGEAVSPATDLYTLGVVMYELATGELPWPSPARLGELEPRWAAAIRRCLAAHPADRFASASELLAAIAPPRSRRRGVVLAAVAGVALIVAATIALLVTRGGEAAADPCADSARPLIGVWDAARRESLALAFGNAAAASRIRIEAALDRHAAQWVDLSRGLCRDREARREPPDALGARGRCLARGLTGVRALTGQLTSAIDVDTAAIAVRVAEGLEPLDRCADGAALIADRALPAADDPGLDQRLAEVQVLIDLARYAAAVTEAEAAERDAAGAPRRHAAALFLLARARMEQGELVKAEVPLREAIRLAAQVGDDATLARCWVALVHLLSQLGRLGESAMIASVAEAAVVRADNDPRLALNLQHYLADTEAWDDHYGRAVARFEAAIPAAEAALGPRDPDLLLALTKYAEILNELSRPQDAIAIAGRARSGAVEAFGPDDFRVALADYVIGMAERDLGHFEVARPLLERALAVATGLSEDHPGRVHTHVELGRLHLMAGDLALAEELLTVAVSRARALPGPDQLRIGMALGDLAEVRLARGDLVAAEALWRQALDVRRRLRGDSNASVGRAWSALGMIAVARGDRATARSLLEDAVRVLATAEVAVYPALARARLGRLLWSSPRERARSIELAAQARPDLQAPSGERPLDLPELEQWVAAACRVGPCAITTVP